MDCQISLIDGQIALRVDDFVVDACTILETDFFHIDGIRIRIFVGISSRATGLIHGIGAAGLDGQDIRAVIQLIAIDNRLARHAFRIADKRCGKGPVVDGCIAIGLVAAAVDVDLASEDFDGAAILCSGIFIAACFTFVRQVVAVRSSFDVVNCLVIGFTGRCFIAARTRCGLCPAFARERAAAVVVVGYIAFVEGIRIFVDVMFVLILSNERCFSCGRDIGIRQFLAVDFRHVVSGDINGRLYLEDVLVAVVRCSILIKVVGAVGVCMPAGCRLAVEVRAEIVAVWRCGVDFPVAARSSRDSIPCLCCIRRVMEGTICSACIDDNGIVCRRTGNQRAVVRRAIFIDSDFTRCALADELDIICGCNAVNQDIALRGDIYTAVVRRDAIADCDAIAINVNAIASNVNAIVDMDDTREGCTRLIRAATDIDRASIRDVKVAQRNRMTNVALQVNIAAITIDDKAGMYQILFLDKASRRAGHLIDIVPVRGGAITDGDVRAAVVRFLLYLVGGSGFTAIPLHKRIVGCTAILLRKFRAITIIGQPLWARDPVIAIRMSRISWFVAAI